MNSDLIELLSLLNEFKVKYLVIGGQAVILYSEPRYTKDLDIWVEATKTNAKKLVKVLKDFGAPSNSISEDDFSKPGTIFIFGIEPNRVDILTKVKGATFAPCYKNKTVVKVDGVKICFVSIEDLIKIKKATNRSQDRLYLVNLKIGLKEKK